MRNNNIRAMLIHHEGLRLKPYKCTAGKLTIGVGRNLDDRGITQEEAMNMLENDIDDCRIELQHNISWFNRLDPTRKDALLDMCFNLGISGLMKFNNMLTAMKHEDWEAAYVEALDSRWADQVGQRAIDIAGMILIGDNE